MNLINEEYNRSNPFGLETDSYLNATRKETTVSIIQNHIWAKGGSRLLDAGCGKGLITLFMKQEMSGLVIDAIDISQKAIEHAKKSSSEINFSVADIVDFKGYGYKYDIIILNNVYEHVENPIGVLKNIKMLLEKDGIILISTPNRYNTRNILRKLLGMNIAIPEYHVTEYSLGQLYDHHRYAGLKILNIIIPKLRQDRFKLSSFIIFKIVEPLINRYLRMLNSRTRTGRLLFVVSGSL